MRILGTSLVVIATLLAVTACSSKQSSNSSAGSTSASATTDAGSAAATSDAGGAAATATTAAGDVPSYPGATTQASGSSSNMGQAASGSVMTTDDSFDKVYAWYQQHMPAGSEKSHVTAPIQSAVFTLGDPGSAQTSLTITTSGGKTMITIAHVKM